MTTTSKPSKGKQLLEDIAAQIIASIEAGASNGVWTKPWNAASGLPHNASTGAPYSGGNLLWLWVSALDNGYPTQVWATYKQWGQLGAQVRKGEKATSAVKWVLLECKDHDADERCNRCGAMIPVGFSLFNAAQVDGYEPEVEQPRNLDERLEDADRFFAAVNATVTHGGNQAAFDRRRDVIMMPEFEAFESASAYYGTLAHEMTHWTGHPSRLDRDFGKRFGDDAYAFEELVAELGAAMLCGHLQINEEPRPDHAQYLTSWLKVLKADSQALWTAASAASKAAQHLIAAASKAKVEVEA